MTERTPARHIGFALCCIIALLLAAGCETPVGVERLDASTAQRRLTANVLTTDELSPQAHNVLRRRVLSELFVRLGRNVPLGRAALPQRKELAQSFRA